MAIVNWRREDWGYAAATIVAAALVGYLVAGNFGLVRSPFTPAHADGAPAQIPALLGPSTNTSGSIPVADGAAPDGTASPTSPDAAAATDVAPPQAAVTSGGGAEISLTKGSEVAGTATDDDSGIDQVAVTFQAASGQTTTVPAVITCSDDARTNCTWTAAVPDLAGSYTVTAQVKDRIGNIGLTDPHEITVVNLGGIVEDVTDGLTAVVDGLTALLLGARVP